MGDRKRSARERAAGVAAMRAAQERQARRRRLLVYGAVAAVAVVLIGVAAWVIRGAAVRQAAIEAAAEEPIAGVDETQDLSRAHVTDQAEPTAAAAGTLLPPVGGAHDPVWQNCGIYSEPVGTFHAVHSLEHGAVWVTYRPDLAGEQVAELEALLEGRDYTILSPFPDLAAPIVLTAWGVQLELDDADDERIPVFLAKYVLGPQTPEPGAACTGGLGIPG